MGVGVPLLFLGTPGVLSETALQQSGHGSKTTEWILVSSGVALTAISVPLINNAQKSNDGSVSLRGEDLNFYKRKHSTLKTLAWVSLGVGVTLVIGSQIVYFNDFDKNEWHPVSMRTLWNAGAILTGASIPLFIAASSYKKRATSTNLSFDMQRIDLPQASGISSVVQPGIKFSVAF